MKTSKETWRLTSSIIVFTLGILLRNLPIQLIGIAMMLISIKRVKDQLSKTEKYIIYAACIVYLCSLVLYLL